MEKITIIMPFLNEGVEPQDTIDSIYETASPKRFEIIAIDDCSKEKSKIIPRKEVKLIRNDKRMGVDACRQLGFELSTTPNIFVIDAHMRFQKGWLPRIVDCIEREPETLWCTKCIGLGYGNMDMLRSRDYYYGANFVLSNGSNGSSSILEPKWRDSHNQGEYEIPCILGANYGFSKKWFEHIHGLKGLRMWGGSELFMSLKTWMAGGSCKITNDIRIGHKFRNNSTYSTSLWNLYYNKLYMCETLFPNDLKEALIKQLPRNTNLKRALREIEKDELLIKKEKEYYQKVFTRDIKSVCDQWDVEIPC
jgi:glycosyltransferase involved in cell wall biosynthesis